LRSRCIAVKCRASECSSWSRSIDVEVDRRHAWNDLDRLAQAALQKLDGLVCLGQEEEPVGPCLVEVPNTGAYLRNLEQLARVVVVTVDHQANPAARIDRRLAIFGQTAQELQRFVDVAGFHLAAGEHQDDGVGDGGAEALVHTGSTNVGDSPRDELTARHTL